MLNSKSLFLLSACFGNLFPSSSGNNAAPSQLRRLEDSGTPYSINPGVPIGEPCIFTFQCLARTPYSHCNWTSSDGTITTGVCACLYGHANSKGQCPGRQFGQPCTSDQQCKKLNFNSLCSLTVFTKATHTCFCLYGMDESGTCTFPSIDLPTPRFEFDTSSSDSTDSTSYSSYFTGYRVVVYLVVFALAFIFGIIGAFLRKRRILAQRNPYSRQIDDAETQNTIVARQNPLRRVLTGRPNALSVGQNPRAAEQRDPVPTQPPFYSGFPIEQLDIPPPPYETVAKQDSLQVGDRQFGPTGRPPGSAL